MERTNFKSPHRELIKRVAEPEILLKAGIKERDRQVFIDYFTKQLTLNEVGEFYNIGGQRVMQIVRRVLRRLSVWWGRCVDRSEVLERDEEIERMKERIAFMENKLGYNTIPVEELNVNLRS